MTFDHAIGNAVRRSGRVALLLSIISLDVHAAGVVRHIFTGSLAEKIDVNISIVVLPDREIVGATFYQKAGVNHPFFFPEYDIHRLIGRREAKNMVLVENLAGSEGATIVATLVNRGLRGTWCKAGSERRIPFDLREELGWNVLREPNNSWAPLDRMHDAILSGRLDVAAAEARLACAISDEGCSWVEALPSVVRGIEPPPAKLSPWRGYLLYVQGRLSDAVAEGRKQCNDVYTSSRSACTFLVDRAPELPAAQQETIYTVACQCKRVACSHVFGTAEVALAEAAERADAASVEQILKKHVNVNFGNESRYSPLFSATAMRSVPIVKVLLDHGADPNLRFGYELPLEFAVSNREDEIAMLLLDHGAKVAGARGVLWDAVSYGNDAIALKMLEQGDDPDDLAPAGTPLTAAVDRHDLKMVQALLEHGANPDREGKFSEGSPIDHARRTHQTKILRMLLAAQKTGVE